MSDDGGKVLEQGAIGNVGTQSVEFVGGQMVAKASVAVPYGSVDLDIVISPKAILDAIAAKVGGPIPAEVAAFLEQALGLK